jgi:hypothetical protein
MVAQDLTLGQGWTPRGPRWWHCPQLTQHCIVQAHIDYSFEVQHAKVAL